MEAIQLQKVFEYLGADLKFKPCTYYCCGMYFGPEIGICIFKYNLGSLISPHAKKWYSNTDIFSEYNVVCPNGLITKIPQILYEF